MRCLRAQPSGTVKATASPSSRPPRAEQAIIARAQAPFRHGPSLRAIAAKLTADGRSGRTGKGLSSTQVHRFLSPLLVLAVA